MKRVLLTFAMVACAVQPAFAQKGDAPDPIVTYSDRDAVMNEAIVEARRTLPHFFAELDAAPVARRGDFSVKVGMAAEGGGTEHIWVSDLRRENGQLIGALANEPHALPGLHRGSPVVVEQDLISDWAIQTHEGLYGAYTTRVMLPDLDADTAAEMRAILTPVPTPAWWQS